MKSIVLLSGWKGSGKDTIADYLVNNFEYKRVAFADHLKDMASKEYDIPRHYFDDRNYKEAPLLQYPITPKDAFGKTLAQTMFKEFRDYYGNAPIDLLPESLDKGELYGLIKAGNRTIASRLYHTPRSLAILKGSVNRFVESSYWVKQAVIIMAKNPIGKYVISDVRYKSEIEQIKEIAGNDKVLTVRINRFETTDSTDASERDLDDYSFDHVLKNNDSIENLFKKIDLIIK